MTDPPFPSTPPLIVLLGPTAVGKTELSLRLAERFDGEVVSADSRQVYRGMDIGTAKATPAEQRRVRHHLLDIRDPDQTLSLAEYQQLAYTAINDIQRRGRVPFLVGGSALYLRAVVLGLRIPAAPPDSLLRARLEAELSERGLDALAAHLRQIDPATAAAIDLHNPRRVLRALEVVLTTGKSKVDSEGAEPPPFRILQIGVQRPRANLHRRIDDRVDAMIAQGLVAETERLLAAGYDPALPALSSLGYREIGAYLRGECSLEQAAERIKIETHRFLRHQSTWFRKMAGVDWFDLEEMEEEQIFTLTTNFLGV